MLRLSKRHLNSACERGVVLAEFTAMLPVFLFLVFAMYEVGNFFYATEQVHSISREAANMAFKHCLQLDLQKNPGASGSASAIASYNRWRTESSECFTDDASVENDYVTSIQNLAARIYPDFLNASTVKGTIIISVYDWNPATSLWERRGDIFNLPIKYGSASHNSKLAATYNNNDIIGVFGTIVYAEAFADYVAPPTSIVGNLPGLSMILPKDLYRVTLM